MYETPEFFFPEALSETGVVGGYSRISPPTTPLDVPVLWDPNGDPSPLIVNGVYEVGYVSGFRADGTPLGTVRRPGEIITQPGIFTGNQFVQLTGTGVGGNAISGNDTLIVGQTFQPTSTPGVNRLNATLWNGATATPLPGLEDVESTALSVASDGLYVGAYLDISNPSDFKGGVFIGRDGGVTRLNFPGFTETRGFEINDDGWFTGVYEPQFAQQRGFIARHDLNTGQQEIFDLGIFPGFGETIAHAINNDRTIVGGAQVLGGDYGRALIWPNGSLVAQDLNLFVNVPGATLIQAYRINNAGQILAEARLDGGGFAYYRLDPIPEPAVALFSLVAGFAWDRRRPRRHL